MLIGICWIIIGVLGLKYGAAFLITGITSLLIGLGLKKSS